MRPLDPPVGVRDARSMLRIGVFLLHLEAVGEARPRRCGSRSGPQDREEGEVEAHTGQVLVNPQRGWRGPGGKQGNLRSRVCLGSNTVSSLWPLRSEHPPPSF